MAVPFMYGPGGQPIMMGQIPIIAQPVIQQQQTRQMPPPQPKVPDYMAEEKLQEKGKSKQKIKLRVVFPNRGD